MLVGDIDELAALHHRALRLSPNAPDAFWSLTGIGMAELLKGNFEFAINWCLRSLATFNEWPMTYWALVPSYAHLDRMDEARAALGKLLAISARDHGGFDTGQSAICQAVGGSDGRTAKGRLAAGIGALRPAFVSSKSAFRRSFSRRERRRSLTKGSTIVAASDRPRRALTLADTPTPPACPTRASAWPRGPAMPSEADLSKPEPSGASNIQPAPHMVSSAVRKNSKEGIPCGCAAR